MWISPSVVYHFLLRNRSEFTLLIQSPTWLKSSISVAVVILHKVLASPSDPFTESPARSLLKRAAAGRYNDHQNNIELIYNQSNVVGGRRSRSSGIYSKEEPFVCGRWYMIEKIRSRFDHSMSKLTDWNSPLTSLRVVDETDDEIRSHFGRVETVQPLLQHKMEWINWQITHRRGIPRHRQEYSTSYSGIRLSTMLVKNICSRWLYEIHQVRTEV